MTVTDLLATWAKAMTAAGIPPAQQIAAFRHTGIVIGHGGQGSTESDTTKTCPYCHATGNGGHGGFCPSAGRAIPVNGWYDDSTSQTLIWK
jgi:hypothetical protein